MDARKKSLTRLGLATAGLITLTLLLTLLTLWTAAKAQDERQRWLDALNALPGVGATWLSIDDGVFTQRGELHLSILDANSLLAHWPLAHSATVDWQSLLSSADLYLSIDSYTLPGWLQHDARLILSRGTPGQWQQSGVLSAGEHHLILSAALWQEPQLTLESDAWQLNLAPLVIHCGTTQLHWQAAPNRRQQQINWQLASLELSSADQHTALGDWRGALTLVRQNNSWLLPVFNSQLGLLQHESAERRLALFNSDLKLTTSANLQGLVSLIDLQAQGQLEKGEWVDQTHAYQLAKLNTGILLSGIDIQGYQTLLWAAMTQFEDSTVWRAALNRVTRSGFHMRIAPSGFQLANNAIHAQGDVTSRPFDMAELHDLASFRSLLQASLDIEAAGNLAPVITDEATLLAIRQAGYIEDRAGRLSSRLRIVNGKLSANGYALHW